MFAGDASCCGKTITSNLQLAAASLSLLLICIKLSSVQLQTDAQVAGIALLAAAEAPDALPRIVTENEWLPAAFDAHEAFGVSPQLELKIKSLDVAFVEVCHLLSSCFFPT